MIMLANDLRRVEFANIMCIHLYNTHEFRRGICFKNKKRTCKSYEVISIYALQFVPVFKASSLNRCNRRKSRNQFLRSKRRLLPYNLLSEIYFTAAHEA